MSGDRIVAQQGATVINRSNLINAFNKIASSSGNEVADAMKLIGKEVEASGNPSAAVIFQQFAEEAQKPERDHKVMRSYWDTIVALVPHVAKLTDAVAKVASLFS